ncbi:hypothetical protein [Coleofasciculus sp. FACHB-1120]|nr:hypothetical protein [Coleofasciculus sp. FACHB-1120]MBD2744600.1 hypothetical protein [Coleofasciculus sp. FACHB-1120]
MPCPYAFELGLNKSILLSEVQGRDLSSQFKWNLMMTIPSTPFGIV